MAEENALRRLEAYDQSVWLDFIRRSMLVRGDFERYVERDGVSGFTSNPSIFETVIAGSHDYDEALDALALEGKAPEAVYEALALEDVRMGADALMPTFRRTQGRDGCASFEVSPRLAYDTSRTIEEARRLFRAIGHPNAMIKVPATAQGVPAIRQLTSSGVNVNVTLLFGLGRYREVAEAYVAGLEDRLAAGEPLDGLVSVASFFLSRIDVLLDPVIDRFADAEGPAGALAKRARGQVAIASAKAAYGIYTEIFHGERFATLAEHGARPQRLLWASTSTKDPTYSDVKYVEALIGPETVNTMPLETLEAYRDHGQPQPRLERDARQAEELLAELPTLGIDLDEATSRLEREGVEKFESALDGLLSAIRERSRKALLEPLDPQVTFLGQYAPAVEERLRDMEAGGFARRLWRKDTSLWVSDPKAAEPVRDGLGWLHLPEKMVDNVPEMRRFLSELREDGFTHVVHIGMGGSSLAPLMFSRIFEPAGDGLPLTVLDTTDPATVARVEGEVPLASTLFIIASKSGTTAEPIALGDYFFEKVGTARGGDPGEAFVAITDPGSPLEAQAHKEGFRHCFLNFADIGGRYSALSFFGMLPATLMGVDTTGVLERAQRMAHACADTVPERRDPGIVLGAIMGELALAGRDKVTFVTPEKLRPLGMWLEQLLAESTGKEGTGLLPVAGEPLGPPEVYGDDRLFVHLSLSSHPDEAIERGVEALRRAGHPVVAIELGEPLDVGEAFYRFEIAVATAGSVLGIDAFDQPNVQESKDITNEILGKVASGEGLPEERPSLTDGPVRLYGDAAGSDAADALAHFVGQARPGDYVAIMAYVAEDGQTDEALQTLRVRARDATHAATTVGYGPRFLHSTGQYHKGGPNAGVFVQITAEDAVDVPIPGRSYTFGKFKRAQALGDLEALRRHGRRVVRVDVGGANVASELRKLSSALGAAKVTAR